jgi:hypothetical protein
LRGRERRGEEKREKRKEEEGGGGLGRGERRFSLSLYVTFSTPLNILLLLLSSLLSTTLTPLHCYLLTLYQRLLPALYYFQHHFLM